MVLRDRVLALRAQAWAAPLDHEGLVLLAQHARHRSFRKGDVLLEPGKRVESMFIVERGLVTVKIGGTLLTQVTPGRVAGVTALIARDPRGASAIADEDCRVLEIPGEALFAAYEENFSVVRNGIRLFSRGALQRRDRLPRSPDSDSPAPMGTYREGTMTLVDRVRQAQQTRLFSKANLDAVFDVARNAVERRLAPDEPLWSIAEPPSFWVYVEYGRLRCTNADGRSTQVGANFVLGQLDCLARAAALVRGAGRDRGDRASDRHPADAGRAGDPSRPDPGASGHPRADEPAGQRGAGLGGGGRGGGRGGGGDGDGRGALTEGGACRAASSWSGLPDRACRQPSS